MIDKLEKHNIEKVHSELLDIIDDNVLSSTEKVKQIMRDRGLCERLYLLDDDVAQYLDTMPP